MPSKIKYLPDVKYDNRFIRNMYTVVGNEISTVGTPCYMPKLIKYYADLKAGLGVTEEQIKDFKTKNFKKEYQAYKVLNDKQTMLALIAIIHFARARKKDVSKLFADYLAIKYFSSEVHKSFPKYCNQDAWILALDKVSHKHLFKVQGGIPSTIQYVSDAVYKKYGRNFNNNRLTDKELVFYSSALRRRLAQSTQSFAQVYYKILEEPDPVQKKEEADEKISMVANKVSEKMCTYGIVDKPALKVAILKSGIRKELARLLISELSIEEFREEMRFIIILMNKLTPIKKICKESGRMSLIRRVLSKQKVDKYIVYDRILEIVKSTESSYQFNTVQDNQIVSFFSQYLTSFLKNRIC